MDVSNASSTVPVYPFFGAAVIVDVPLLPCVTVTPVAASEKLPVPEDDPETLIDRAPVDAACVLSPAYAAITWCVPAVENALV